ncbi:MAG: polymer-forming cytoskeletal protein [Saprospiraceae bacterium]
MFGGKQSSNGKPATTPTGGSAGLNSLVKGTHIEGKIKAPSDIRIEGTLEGDLDCQAKVIIGPSGVINGTVKCRTAMIEGSFEGNLTVSELLEVRDSARVQGDVTYGKIKIDAGAVLIGNIQMTGGAGKAKGSHKAAAVA